MIALLGVVPPAVGGAETPNNAGTVTAVAGPVTVARLSGPQPLKFRDSLFWRDVLEARKDGIARVLLAGKTTVTVRELSRLELREEAMAEGMRYTAELVSGKVRASVARMLMRPGDQVEVRTKNAVASVRGTDFIVETLVLPSQGRAFGLLGGREVVQALADGSSQPGETVVVTLSGAVDVTNRLSGSGRVERVQAYEAVRVSGRHEPLRFQVSADDLRVLLEGLTPPRPQEARSGDRNEAVGSKVERMALATSAKSVRIFEQAGGGGGSRSGRQDDDETAQGASQSQSQGNGNGPPLGQVSGQADGKAEKVDKADKQEGAKAEKADKAGKPDKGSAVGQSNAQPVTSTASTGAAQDPGKADKGLGAGPSKSQGNGQGSGLALGQSSSGPAVGQSSGSGSGKGNGLPLGQSSSGPGGGSGSSGPGSSKANAGVGQAVGKPATPPGQAKK